MRTALIFTIFQFVWAIWWARLHIRIRRNHHYAHGRTKAATDKLYRYASPLLYMMQNIIFIASFWSNAQWLLKFHDSDAWRLVGFILLLVGSALYAWALRHLGVHYSPCYDSHLPAVIIDTGPYRWVRHPMYAAKFLIGAATIVVSGSLWFIPTTIYFFWTTYRTILREDANLQKVMPQYSVYQSQTAMLIPWCL